MYDLLSCFSYTHSDYDTSLPILLDEVTCSSSDNLLLLCSHPGIGVHGCGHSDDILITCSNSNPALSSELLYLVILAEITSWLHKFSSSWQTIYNNVMFLYPCSWCNSLYWSTCSGRCNNTVHLHMYWVLFSQKKVVQDHITNTSCNNLSAAS